MPLPRMIIVFSITYNTIKHQNYSKTKIVTNDLLESYNFEKKDVDIVHQCNS